MNVTSLYEHYGSKIIPMCKGTALEKEPWMCVQYLSDGYYMKFHNHPDFSLYPDPTLYRLAIAVLEGKQVFKGDVIYYKCDGESVKILDGDAGDDVLVVRVNDHADTIMINDDDFTWNKPKPKRTFNLGGNDLPCPIVDTKRDLPGFGVGGWYFRFESARDARTVSRAIAKILLDAQVSHD